MADIGALRALIADAVGQFGVPGASVAVIAGGEVVLCEGFGVRSLEDGAPVTASTQFPIASDTKCFTAALLCLQAADGLVDLDAPVREVLPWFEMADPHATALASVRDLLSHRTGLPRHDLVWFGNDTLTLEGVARLLRHLPLSRPFRSTWQYNNLCYDTAGYVSEVLAGVPWPVALRARLLEPLGMGATGFVTEPFGPEVATPYTVVDGTHEAQLLPSKGETLPPGGILSTADDLARWLLARLGGGDVLDDEVLAQLHGPTMLGAAGLPMPERLRMGYALGCQVEAYRGHRVVTHGGNLVGFSSMVALAPDDGLAVAVCTNEHGAYLRDALPCIVFDHLLGLPEVDWTTRYRDLQEAGRAGNAEVMAARTAPAGAVAPPARPLADLAGTYVHPGYGSLEVRLDGDTLTADLHGLGDRTRLVHLGGDRWELALPELLTSFPLVFVPGVDGAIESVALRIEPLVDPLPFRRVVPEPTAAQVAAVTGRWAKGPLEVAIAGEWPALKATITAAGAHRLVHVGDGVFSSSTLPALRISPSGEQLLVDPSGLFDRAPAA